MLCDMEKQLFGQSYKKRKLLGRRSVLQFFWATVDLLIQGWPLELTEVKCLSGLYVPVNVNHGPPTSGTVFYSVTFRLLPRPLGESGLLLSPPLGPQSARSGGPCPLGGSGGMPPRKFCDCFCWMRARLACLLSLLTHNVNRYLIHQDSFNSVQFNSVIGNSRGDSEQYIFVETRSVKF